MCFMIVGLLIQELTVIFVAIKHDLAIAYVLIGFFIAELVKPKAPLKALGALFTSVIRNYRPLPRWLIALTLASSVVTDWIL